MADTVVLTCTHCEGRGTRVVIACPGFRRMEVPCFRCDGRGQRTPADLVLEAAGDTLRELRHSYDLTQRQVAKILCIQPSRVTDLEWGRHVTEDMITAAKVQLMVWKDGAE